MGKQFGKKRGFKRPKNPGKFKLSRCSKKNRREEEEKIVHSPSPSSSGELSEEENGNLSSVKEIDYEETSKYDELLNMLCSSSKPVADANKQRQGQEEGKSGTKQDRDDGSESSDDGEDEEHDCGTDDESAAGPSVTESPFNKHFTHILSKEEVDNFSTKKWKYEWKVPASGMSNCRWVGTGECFLKDVDVDADHDIKPKLYQHWLNMYKTSGGNDFHSSNQRFFFTLCNSYRDILHCNRKPFYIRGSEEDSSTMDAYIMHCLNHVFKTRDLVIKNDAKAAKFRENDKNAMLNDDSLRDQGYTRPKVLIMLPFKSTALRVVKRLIQLTPSAHKANIEHLDRFYNDFGTKGIEDDEEENEAFAKSQKSSKPSDFQSLFGGNSKDDFVVGIKFTRRSIKLYGDFYSSDIIIASALGFCAKIDQIERDKGKDVDYISSIEVLVIDYAEVIAMQNWVHLVKVVKHVNLMPSKQHGTDIMRIRHWHLDGYARFYRQTILLSSYLNPDMNALFNHHCVNYRGKVKLECEYKGVLPKVQLQVQQIYQRFGSDSVTEINDARLDYFLKKVFPKLQESTQGGIMIFISSYFDFVRIRNFMKSQDASFCMLSEYTEPSDISRARLWFFEGKKKIVLYTERMHFYHRYKIRGIKNLFFYSLPERKDFYPELLNMLEGDDATTTALFSRFDQLRLERIVGTANAKRMVKSEKDVFVFC